MAIPKIDVWRQSAFGNNIEVAGDNYRAKLSDDTYTYLQISPGTFIEQEQQVIEWLKELGIDLN